MKVIEIDGKSFDVIYEFGIHSGIAIYKLRSAKILIVAEMGHVLWLREFVTKDSNILKRTKKLCFCPENL